ncbi:hypothetical protein MalM25_23860 [Planctomycetes bacterium MalM25]|nr:hypothetical protein MalM25_23860 [Planctomycetes bacterium MalM25]
MLKTFWTAAAIALATALTSDQTRAFTVASDDFDAPLNLISYSAIDFEGNDPTNTGVWSSSSDSFGPRSVNDFYSGGLATGNYVSDTLIDRTVFDDPTDTLGIVTDSYTGNFFAIVDTDNGVNPSGGVTGTWVFDISSAASVTSFDVDMAAIGNFFDNGEGSFERFTWSYSIDGGPETEIFTVRADESAGPVTYTLASGTMTTVPANTAAGPDDNGVTIDGVPLLNDLTTISRPIAGSGGELTLTLFGFVNDNGAGLVIDNLEILGADAPESPGDFNGDGFVNVADYTVWRDNEGLAEDGSTLAGNGDGGLVGPTDYTLWADNFGRSFPPSISAIPEPAGITLLIAAAAAAVSLRR